MSDHKIKAHAAAPAATPAAAAGAAAPAVESILTIWLTIEKDIYRAIDLAHKPPLSLKPIAPEPWLNISLMLTQLSELDPQYAQKISKYGNHALFKLLDTLPRIKGSDLYKQPLTDVSSRLVAQQFIISILDFIRIVITICLYQAQWNQGLFETTNILLTSGIRLCEAFKRYDPSLTFQKYLWHFDSLYNFSRYGQFMHTNFKESLVAASELEIQEDHERNLDIIQCMASLPDALIGQINLPFLQLPQGRAFDIITTLLKFTDKANKFRKAFAAAAPHQSPGFFDQHNAVILRAIGSLTACIVQYLNIWLSPPILASSSEQNLNRINFIINQVSLIFEQNQQLLLTQTWDEVHHGIYCKTLVILDQIDILHIPAIAKTNFLTFKKSLATTLKNKSSNPQVQQRAQQIIRACEEQQMFGKASIKKSVPSKDSKSAPTPERVLQKPGSSAAPTSGSSSSSSSQAAHTIAPSAPALSSASSSSSARAKSLPTPASEVVATASTPSTIPSSTTTPSSVAEKEQKHKPGKKKSHPKQSRKQSPEEEKAKLLKEERRNQKNLITAQNYQHEIKKYEQEIKRLRVQYQTQKHTLELEDSDIHSLLTILKTEQDVLLIKQKTCIKKRDSLNQMKQLVSETNDQKQKKQIAQLTHDEQKIKHQTHIKREQLYKIKDQLSCARIDFVETLNKLDAQIQERFAHLREMTRQLERSKSISALMVYFRFLQYQKKVLTTQRLAVIKVLEQRHQSNWRSFTIKKRRESPFLLMQMPDHNESEALTLFTEAEKRLELAKAKAATVEPENPTQDKKLVVSINPDLLSHVSDQRELEEDEKLLSSSTKLYAPELIDPSATPSVEESEPQDHSTIEFPPTAAKDQPREPKVESQLADDKDEIIDPVETTSAHEKIEKQHISTTELDNLFLKRTRLKREYESLSEIVSLRDNIWAIRLNWHELNSEEQRIKMERDHLQVSIRLYSQQQTRVMALQHSIDATFLEQLSLNAEIKSTSDNLEEEETERQLCIKEYQEMLSNLQQQYTDLSETGIAKESKALIIPIDSFLQRHRNELIELRDLRGEMFKLIDEEKEQVAHAANELSTAQERLHRRNLYQRRQAMASSQLPAGHIWEPSTVDRFAIAQDAYISDNPQALVDPYAGLADMPVFLSSASQSVLPLEPDMYPSVDFIPQSPLAHHEGEAASMPAAPATQTSSSPATESSSTLTSAPVPVPPAGPVKIQEKKASKKTKKTKKTIISKHQPDQSPKTSVTAAASTSEHKTQEPAALTPAVAKSSALESTVPTGSVGELKTELASPAQPETKLHQPGKLAATTPTLLELIPKAPTLTIPTAAPEEKKNTPPPKVAPKIEPQDQKRLAGPVAPAASPKRNSVDLFNQIKLDAKNLCNIWWDSPSHLSVQQAGEKYLIAFTAFLELINEYIAAEKLASSISVLSEPQVHHSSQVLKSTMQKLQDRGKINLTLLGVLRQLPFDFEFLQLLNKKSPASYTALWLLFDKPHAFLPYNWYETLTQFSVSLTEDSSQDSQIPASSGKTKSKNKAPAEFTFLNRGDFVSVMKRQPPSPFIPKNRIAYLEWRSSHFVADIKKGDHQQSLLQLLNSKDWNSYIDTFSTLVATYHDADISAFIEKRYLKLACKKHLYLFSSENHLMKKLMLKVRCWNIMRNYLKSIPFALPFYCLKRSDN